MSEPASRRSAESPAHRQLKRLALAWAQARGLELAAEEVRLPRSPYRADLAAAGPLTAVFECKASRADFLRDSTAERGLPEQIVGLSERLAALRGLIAGHLPELRRGEALFAEYDTFDWRGLRHPTHRRLERALQVAERKRAEGTKFARLARWRAADELYLVTEEGVVDAGEIPEGWGWLRRRGDGLELAQEPARLAITADQRELVARRIAAVLAARAGRGGVSDPGSGSECCETTPAAIPPGAPGDRS
jgi:hypothetical protein